MGFNKWMMKNGPGSPGSICKTFGEAYSIKKRNALIADNVSIFEDIIKARYPFMHYDRVRWLALLTKGNFLLFIFNLVVYQNKNNLFAFGPHWGVIIEAIYEVAEKHFSAYVDMELMEFSMEAEMNFIHLKHQFG